MIEKTPRIDAYNRHMNGARAALDRGFTAKAHQKDAMDYCNRAFEDAMDMVGTRLLAARDAGTMDGKSKEWIDLYHGRPQAHVWNEKKAAPFLKHFPDLVTLADEAAALRAKIKATPIADKKPSARQAKIAVEDEKRMTCQVCGRGILAETGKIAHHGYQRPGTGWQTASCYGALRLPYEVDRSAILELIPGAQAREKSLREYIADVRAEKKPAVLVRIEKDYRTYPTTEIEHRVEFTRATLPALLKEHPKVFDKHIAGRDDIYDYSKNASVPVYDYYLGVALAMDTLTLENVVSWRKYLEERRDGWKHTHDWNATAKIWEAKS